jgi:membrane-associated phospholipid phosphatase
MKFRYLTLLAVSAVLFTPSELCAKKSAFRTYGDVFQIVIPVSALVTSVIKEDYEGCWQLTKSFAAAMAANGLLKLVVHRKRPTGNGKHSFPSGHTTSAFAGAAYLVQRYGLPYGVPAYAAATAVGCSRVHAKAHGWDEVIVGAGLGILANVYFTTSYVAHESRNSENKVEDFGKEKVENQNDKPLENTALPTAKLGS